MQEFRAGVAQAINYATALGVKQLNCLAGKAPAGVPDALPRIAHIQIVANPGRKEPGAGAIGWDFLFTHLDRIGYRGWVGCEYKPAGSTEAGLGWLAKTRG